MPTINKSVVVPYTQKQMFDLVNDIQSYPQFVPWCTDSEILLQTPDEIRANLSFSKSGLTKSFTTVNRLLPHKMIEMRLLEGPFKQLEGFWRFESGGASDTKVMLDMEFEFSTKLLAIMFGPVFHQVALMLVDAFTERAKVVYGS